MSLNRPLNSSSGGDGVQEIQIERSSTNSGIVPETANLLENQNENTGTKFIIQFVL